MYTLPFMKAYLWCLSIGKGIAGLPACAKALPTGPAEAKTHWSMVRQLIITHYKCVRPQY